MKTIGRTDEGKILVEMSQEEHNEFVRLEMSIDGNYYFGGFQRGLSGKDLAPVFGALGDLATAKQSVSSLTFYINKLSEIFGKTHTVKEQNENIQR